MWSYGLKFLPSLLVLVAIYGTTLMSLCTNVSPDCTESKTCLWIYPAVNGSVAEGLWSGWGEPAHR